MGLRGTRLRANVRSLESRGLAAAGLVGISLLLLTAAARASTADRAATHTYLQATYVLDVAVAGNNRRANQVVKQTGAAIAAECPKVLAGAPGGPAETMSSRGGKQLSPRAQGESDRRQRQFSALTNELETDIRSQAFRLDETAFAAYAATVGPLRWSNPAIARSIQAEVTIVHAAFDPGPPQPVCADMRSWVSSGYRTLSAGTRASQAQQEELFGAATLFGLVSPEAAIKRYEGPRERAIVRRTKKLHSADLFETGGTQGTKLREALGIKEPEASRPPHKRTVIGRGRTRTGDKFEVEVSRGFGPHCRDIVSFSYTVNSPEGSFSSSSSSSARCLSGSTPAPRASVSCEEGAIKIESSTLARTRRVRLNLSDGRTVTSSVTLVAKRYGGPAGAYFQSVRGPTPYPVSLTELDGSGNALRTVPLRAVRNCRRVVRKPRTPVVRRIAQGKTPTGASFTVTAFAIDERGHHEIHLYGSAVGFPSPVSETLPPSLAPQAAARYFAWQLNVGCATPPFSLIYGQLKPPAASVLVATGASPLAPLTEAPIPPALHGQGMVAYGLLTGLPTELVVKDASGKTLAREDLTARARREAEYCEGYGEPAS